ncbi:MAG: NAD(P)-dependent alcohol dehydrogenase [Alphaproteobacteria bacterium]|nr:NAD(P)-dependent alcohol dehydrogenase [Alphaproteobacteria bacterium]MBU1512972.1 NAD(P)-dependent alcohol dehydrogenase [Alphaproteobacteria bacterium]MBU2094854.1 NAD(P)-dependent alcohol dehydrogenase [Alphaproteobacteria bacterium]MBU2152760.1 NAD(P)-dependent alcohol dehydrogenase [Alphaproteobacteria bacterium]MBU2306331.1 NAD(P)-dependent alcohol dehydrogenase [Alphaproteobacteria bacterium]
MRALNITAPWGPDAIQVVEVPDPTPGQGQVLVRMKACSLNYRDFLMIHGMYGRAAASATDIITPFSDGCGYVEAVGPGVTRFKAGDRVSTLFFQNWVSGPPTLEKLMSALGFPIPGAGAELQVFSQEGLSKVPDFLTDNEVATLPCAALTAWRGVFQDARLEPADTVVLQGTGGVSIFGLQFAKAAGYRTIITSSSDEKLERAKALGADHVVNYKTTPEWSKAVRAATGGKGADFIMEVGGGGTIQESMKAIKVGGHIAIIGIVAGAGEPFNPAALIGNSAKLQGLSVGSRDMFEPMCRAIELHQIRPVVDKVYPWTEAKAAIGAMAAGEHFGKIVLEF